MNIAEAVYKETVRIIDEQSIVVQVLWVAIIAGLLSGFFWMVFSGIGLEEYVVELTVTGVVISVGGLLVSIAVFGERPVEGR